MEDVARLIVYVVIGLVWFLLQAKRPKGEDQQPPWEELPPIPRPRPTPPQRVPTPGPAPTTARQITIGPKKAAQLTLADYLQTLAAQRAPITTVAMTPPTAPTAASSWSLDLSTPNKIAEGVLLSAILGPPKASAYLRRITRYWQ